LHVGFDGDVEAADLGAATGDQDAVLQAILEFRVEGADQLAEALDERGAVGNEQERRSSLASTSVIIWHRIAPR